MLPTTTSTFFNGHPVYIVKEKIFLLTVEKNKYLICNIIIDSALIADAVIYDGKSNMKRFSNGKISVVPVKYKHKKKYVIVKPWWDEDCQKVDYRKKCYKNFVSSPSRDNLAMYRLMSASTRKTLKKKKKENFENFVNNINLKSGPGVFWRTIELAKVGKKVLSFFLV